MKVILVFLSILLISVKICADDVPAQVIEQTAEKTVAEVVTVTPSKVISKVPVNSSANLLQLMLGLFAVIAMIFALIWLIVI